MKRSDRLTGPWRIIQVAIWLLGLTILYLQDWYWPGILALFALDIILCNLRKLAHKEDFHES